MAERVNKEIMQARFDSYNEALDLPHAFEVREIDAGHKNMAVALIYDPSDGTAPVTVFSMYNCGYAYRPYPKSEIAECLRVEANLRDVRKAGWEFAFAKAETLLRNPVPIESVELRSRSGNTVVTLRLNRKHHSTLIAPVYGWLRFSAQGHLATANTDEWAPAGALLSVLAR